MYVVVVGFVFIDVVVVIVVVLLTSSGHRRVVVVVVVAIIYSRFFCSFFGSDFNQLIKFVSCCDCVLVVVSL